MTYATLIATALLLCPLQEQTTVGDPLAHTVANIRNGQIEDIEDNIASLAPGSLRNTLGQYVAYLKTGHKPGRHPSYCPKDVAPAMRPALQTLFHYDLFHLQAGRYDSLATLGLTRLLQHAPSLPLGNERQLLASETLYRLIHSCLQSSPSDGSCGGGLKAYIDQYRALATTPVAQYYAHLFTGWHKMVAPEHNRQPGTPDPAAGAFHHALKLARSGSYHYGLVHALLGQLHHERTTDGLEAIAHLTSAQTTLTNIPFHFAQAKLFSVDTLLATALFKKQHYQKTIAVLKPLLTLPLVTTNHATAASINFRLHQCYDALHNYKRSLAYYEAFVQHTASHEDDMSKKALAQMKQRYDFHKAGQPLIMQNATLLDKKDNLSLTIGILVAALVGVALLALFVYLTQHRLRHKLALFTQNVMKLNGATFHPDTVVYIEADGHFVKVHTTDEGQHHRIRESLSETLQQLPPNFVQIHRSFVVNNNFIAQLFYDRLVLSEGQEIPVGRKYRDHIRVKNHHWFSLVVRDLKAWFLHTPRIWQT